MRWVVAAGRKAWLLSDVSVEVRWDQALVFEGAGRSGMPMVMDGGSTAGPSPMEALLMALASCMAIDVVDILNKMRVAFDGLAVRADADRRPDPPRRFTAVRLTYEVEGVAEDARPKLQRAIDLSRDRYCSVLHSLDPDLALSIRIQAA